MTNSQVLLLIIFPIGFLVGIIWWGSIIYLKYKWLSFVEETIDDNSYSFSSSIFSAGLGVSRYALIFQFDWQAKRCNRLEKKELIPKKVQRLFIISNYLWVIASFIVFGSLISYKIYLI
ncbi:conserved hypothetcial protein [Oleispira antarctica RB-8]|uniref:Conserved hypothetcial protein n=1 Tax=Oleispira antarctica RB-8 TaxID=698738 RepID=R4YQC4_OLEAN|nr:conserved hypothetcial protein [Oleispira antarctica RB-8]|tara:strand:- start:255 stop:611 length:357 start_codon:yes stop_codon:yes gene_type:complete